MNPNLLIRVAALGLMGYSAAAADLFVSTKGRDDWSGLLAQPNEQGSDGPLATITGARDAIRRKKAAGALSGETRVRIAPGIYPLVAPIVFEPQDSGTAAAPITYEAAEAEAPVISAGKEIRGFVAGADGLWTVRIPDVADGKAYFEQLWVNGRRAVRARTPNEGWMQAVAPVSAPVPGVKPVPPIEKTAIQANSDDVELLKDVPPTELRDVNVLVYHSWQVSRHRLAGLDVASGGLQFTGPARWAFYASEPYHRLVFENLRGALDEPGEWFLDRSGVLTYKPREGETPEKAKVFAGAGERWMTFKGLPASNQFIEHLRFRGLKFHYTAFTLPEEGWSSAQADTELAAGIEADGVRKIAFTECEFAHTGGYAMWFRRGCSEVDVRKTHVFDLGGGGVKIGETAVPSKTADATGRVTVDNCIIESGGRIFPGAIGIWVGESGNNTITHNDIADFYYTGISTGWIWGFKDNPCVGNRIEFNHIHHLGWGEMSDLGAVYTLGPSAGSVISNNLVHDIACYSYGGWGLYNDEGSTGFLLENNLVYRTQSGGYHQHYGKENTVRNNIFAFAQDFQVRHSRVEDHLAFTFERNIVLWDTGKVFGHTDAAWQGAQVKLARNLYWRRDNQPFDFAGKSFEQWQAGGQDSGSIIADPNFVAPDAGDFTLKPGSPAEKIGFVPFDYSKAGVYGDAAWRQLANREFRKMDFNSLSLKAPPMKLHEGFELGKVGELPRLARSQTGGRPEAVVISSEHPHSGALCLKVSDGPDAKPTWQPHFYYRPRHTDGTTHVSFWLWLDAAASLVSEWRNVAGVPYRTGPALQIRKGDLTVDDKKLMQLPFNEWVGFDIDAKMGADSPGTWNLRIRVGSGEPREFQDLPFRHADAKTLEWFGFSSIATEESNWWLDDLVIESRK